MKTTIKFPEITVLVNRNDDYISNIKIHMFEKIIKDYFSFTKKERIAVIILVLLLLVIFILPYWIPEQDNELDTISLEKIRLQQLPPNEKEGKRTSMNNGEKYPPADKISNPDTSWLRENKSSKKAELFYFDPNTLQDEGWRKLGLKDKTIVTIHNYVLKGGRFKNREDIGKIYGLRSDEAQLLMPYVKIMAASERSGYERPAYSNYHTSNSATTYKQLSAKARLTDINTADTTELIALPGIGSKLASRIIHFREKLGGFYSVDQVSEIYGIHDSTFQKIRPVLTISNTVKPYININTVQADSLKQHPYIKWNLATAIVEYRRQHGNFNSLEDLHKIELITDEIYQKIVPYLFVVP